MKVTVKADLEIPPDALVYDIGVESFVCKVCGRSEQFRIIGREKCRSGGPSEEQAFKDFVGAHAACIGRLHEQRVRESASQPCRADYRDERGGGPHECGKNDGHGGRHGPG